MRSSTFSSLRGLLAMALLGTASAASPGGLGVGAPIVPIQQALRAQPNKRVRTGDKYTPVSSYPNGPGWTQAKVKRMAKKRRNVLRNRKNHKA